MSTTAIYWIGGIIWVVAIYAERVKRYRDDYGRRPRHLFWWRWDRTLTYHDYLDREVTKQGPKYP